MHRQGISKVRWSDHAVTLSTQSLVEFRAAFMPGGRWVGHQDRPLWSLGIAAYWARHASGHNIGSNNHSGRKKKNHSFSMASVGGPRGFERPTGRQIMHIFQRITARLDTTWNRTPAKSGVLRGEQRRSNERRSTTFRRVPQPSGSTMAAATGRSRQPTLAELLAAWSGCVAAVPLDAAIQRTVPKGFGSAALNVSL